MLFATLHPLVVLFLLTSKWSPAFHHIICPTNLSHKHTRSAASKGGLEQGVGLCFLATSHPLGALLCRLKSVAAFRHTCHLRKKPLSRAHLATHHQDHGRSKGFVGLALYCLPLTSLAPIGRPFLPALPPHHLHKNRRHGHTALHATNLRQERPTLEVDGQQGVGLGPRFCGPLFFFAPQGRCS